MPSSRSPSKNGGAPRAGDSPGEVDTRGDSSPIRRAGEEKGLPGRGLPQAMQKAASSRFSVLHFSHLMYKPLVKL